MVKTTKKQKTLLTKSEVTALVKNSKERRKSRAAGRPKKTEAETNKLNKQEKVKKTEKEKKTRKRTKKNEDEESVTDIELDDEIIVDVHTKKEKPIEISEYHNENYILEIVTSQYNIIKQIIDTLNGPLDDIILKINKKGLILRDADTEKNTLINLELQNENFEYFYCKEEIKIGVNIRKLYDVMRTLTSNTILTIFIDKNDRNNLGIIFKNNNQNSITKHIISLLDYHTAEFEPIDVSSYDAVINMNSSFFHQICRHANTLGNILEIKRPNAENNQLIFAYTSNNVSNNINIEKYIGTSDYMNFIKNEKNDVIIQAYYNVKSFLKFIKLNSMSKQVYIYLSNDYPIMLQYNVGSLGFIQIWIHSVPKET